MTSAKTGQRLVQQPGRLLDLTGIHVPVAQQYFVAVATELSDGLEPDAQPAQLPCQLLVARSIPHRQHDVQAAILSAKANIGAHVRKGRQQAIALAGVMAANSPQVTLQFTRGQQPLQGHLKRPARMQPVALDGFRQGGGDGIRCGDDPIRKAGLIALAKVLTSTVWAGSLAASAAWFCPS